jgi:transcription-repair coupling factor (superfamily II helicase)
MPPEAFLGACRAFTVGMTLQPEAARRELMVAGYARVNVVFEEGQLANRGGILDLWSPAQALPVRLEFFGDEIDTIRTFDPASQRTLDAPVSDRNPARNSQSSQCTQQGRRKL